jgi:hypothetical protein
MEHISLSQQQISSLLGFIDHRREVERIETSVCGRGKGLSQVSTSLNKLKWLLHFCFKRFKDLLQLRRDYKLLKCHLDASSINVN